MKDYSRPTDSTIRKILSNELTQIAGICIALWFFVVNVILPIANIEEQLSSIQLALTDIKASNANLDTRITTNSNDIIVLKQEIKNKFSN